MSHIADVSISARSEGFLVEDFVAQHKISPKCIWQKGENRPWGSVNTSSGFSVQLFSGGAEEFDDALLSKLLDESMPWLVGLKTMGVSASLDIDVVVDNDVSYSPSFELSVATFVKLVAANLEMVLTPCCKSAGGG